jgi:hypothetical protein
MADRKQLDEANEAIQSVLSVPPRGEHFEAMHDRAKPLYEFAFRAVERIANCDLAAVPKEGFLPILKFVGGVNGVANSLKRWKQISASQRDGIADQLADLARRFHGVSHGTSDTIPWGGVAQLVSYYSSDLEPLAREAKENTAKIEHALKDAQQFRDEACGARNEARNAASIDVAGNFAKVFETQAGVDDKTAKEWLRHTKNAVKLTLGVAFSLFVFYCITWLRAGESVHAAFPIGLTVAGVAIISACFYAVAFCGRTYRAHAHNAVLNRHRANALQSFQAFSLGALKNEAARIAVLNYAAQAIFTPQNSGFAPGGESDGCGPTQQIVELVRNVGK